MSLIDVQTEANALLWGYSHMVAITILFWDHVLTLDLEIKYIWRRPRTLSGYIFFANRYYNLLSRIFVFVSLFDTKLPLSCQGRNGIRVWLLVVSHVIITVIMTLRIYALCACNKRLLYFLMSAVVTLLITASATTLYGIHIGKPRSFWLHSDRCILLYDFEATAWQAVAWICVFTYDVLLFGLSLHNALKTRQELRILKNRTSLKVILLRDGAIYFAVVSLAILSNILTYFLAENIMKGGLAYLASSISVTLVSRLMLNLHQVMDAGISMTSCILTVADERGKNGILGRSNRDSLDDV